LTAGDNQIEETPEQQVDSAAAMVKAIEVDANGAAGGGRSCNSASPSHHLTLPPLSVGGNTVTTGSRSTCVGGSTPSPASLGAPPLPSPKPFSTERVPAGAGHPRPVPLMNAAYYHRQQILANQPVYSTSTKCQSTVSKLITANQGHQFQPSSITRATVHSQPMQQTQTVMSNMAGSRTPLPLALPRSYTHEFGGISSSLV